MTNKMELGMGLGRVRMLLIQVLTVLPVAVLTRYLRK